MAGLLPSVKIVRDAGVDQPFCRTGLLSYGVYGRGRARITKGSN
jgi:hypothetical protein